MSVENWLSCDEASELIGCTANHVRLLARQGKIKAKKFTERIWLIDEEAAAELRDKPAKTGRPRKTQKQC
jgi:excisionase family DNA binding protein